MLFFIIGITTVQSQNCTFYFPKKQGTTLVLNHYKAPEKLVSTTTTKVIEQSGDSIQFSSTINNADGKLINSGLYVVKCKNGEFVMDMSSFTNSMNLAAFKNMKTDIQSEDMSLPSNLQPGLQLNNGEVRITVSNQNMTIMRMTVKIINRKVIDVESVTTPAGTFQCWKISYDIDNEGMVTTHSKGIEFISQNQGIVRSESYDSNNNLQSYSVLNSFTE